MNDTIRLFILILVVTSCVALIFFLAYCAGIAIDKKTLIGLKEKDAIILIGDTKICVNDIIKYEESNGVMAIELNDGTVIRTTNYTITLKNKAEK